jgi:hypothetical protein
MTTTQAKAGVAALLAISEAIRELGEVPSGHLYTIVCGHMDLQTYDKAIAIIEGAGLIEQRGHLLRWIGPEVAR